MRARKQSFLPGHVPAPVDGINTIDPLSDMPRRDAVSLLNMIRAEGGLRARTGYAAWVDNVNAGAEIRSVLPYTGAAAAGANDKLFACTTAGIYDCTATGTAPAQSIAFGTSNALSGYGESVIFTTLGGRFMPYTDEINGYILYTEGTGWAAVAQGAGATQVNNVNPALFCHVCSFKNRLWFVERGSTRAWYLPLNQVYGAAVALDFGQQFKFGGQLVGLYAWTQDGGQGSDDLLVAVSSAGDVVVYQGTDPALASTFGVAGRWNVGGVPAGRRLCPSMSPAEGGELLLLTSFGMIPVSKLVAGRSLLTPDWAATDKIRSMFIATMNDRANLTGWSVIPDPVDGSLLVTIPALVGELRQQFAMAKAGGGWAQYSGKPILCGKVWNRQLYFGTADGRLMISKGYIDNVARDGSTLLAKAIAWSGQTAFSDLGSPEQKMMQLITARFVTQGTTPACIMQARYDFDQTPIFLQPPTPALPLNAWDSAKWDSGVFSGTTAAKAITMGASGIGAHVSIAFIGSSIERCSLVGFDAAVTKGGLL